MVDQRCLISSRRDFIRSTGLGVLASVGARSEPQEQNPIRCLLLKETEKDAAGLRRSAAVHLSDGFGSLHSAVRDRERGDLILSTESLRQILRDGYRNADPHRDTRTVFPWPRPTFEEATLRHDIWDVRKQNDPTRVHTYVSTFGKSLPALEVGAIGKLLKEIDGLVAKVGKYVIVAAVVALGIEYAANLYDEITCYQFADLILSNLNEESFLFSALEIDLDKSNKDMHAERAGIWLNECLGFQSHPGNDGTKWAILWTAQYFAEMEPNKLRELLNR